MNELLHDDLDAGRFITLVVCRFDPDSREAEYLGAGHEGLLIRRDGSCETLEPATFPLGLTDDLGEAAPTRVHLEAGDVVCLCTDGFAESQSRSRELFGKPRLIEQLASGRCDSARRMLDRLVDRVSQFTEHETPRDDQTAVVLRVR